MGQTLLLWPDRQEISIAARRTGSRRAAAAKAGSGGLSAYVVAEHKYLLAMLLSSLRCSTRGGFAAERHARAGHIDRQRRAPVPSSNGTATRR